MIDVLPSSIQRTPHTSFCDTFATPVISASCFFSNLRYLALSHVIADVMNLSLNIIHGNFLKLLRCNHAIPLQRRLPSYVLVVEF